MYFDKNFYTKYRQLQEKMRGRAESDGDVFLPNPDPRGPVEFIFICQEPSRGGWANSVAQGKAKIAAGFRNFLADMDMMLLHFSVRQYLCSEGQSYFITDISKGAMFVQQATKNSTQRYNRWYPLLKEEIELIAKPGAALFAVGNKAYDYLEPKGSTFKPLTKILHYSGQAAHARKKCIEGQENDFQKFKRTISKADVVACAREVFDESGVPSKIYDFALKTVVSRQLTDSRCKLVYCYKLAFEAMKRSALHR